MNKLLTFEKVNDSCVLKLEFMTIVLFLFNSVLVLLFLHEGKNYINNVDKSKFWRTSETDTRLVLWTSEIFSLFLTLPWPFDLWWPDYLVYELEIYTVGRYIYANHNDIIFNKM